MKSPNLIIQIPEPCQENWSAMQPDSTGRYCTSCSTSVVDFTGKSDTEIRDILMSYKGQKVCGHFKKSQVNRPLKLSIDLNALPRNMSVTRMFALSLLLVFGGILFSCYGPEGKKIEGIEVSGELPKAGGQRDLIMGGMFVGADTELSPPPPLEEFIEGDVKMGEAMLREDWEEPVEYVKGKSKISCSVTPPDTIATVADSLLPDNKFEVMGLVFPSVRTDTAAGRQLFIPGEPSLVEEAAGIALSVYPNPSTGELTLSYNLLKRTDVRADVYDSQGRWLKTLFNVKEQYDGNYRMPVNLSELPNGVYSVSLIYGDKQATARMIIGH